MSYWRSLANSGYRKQVAVDREFATEWPQFVCGHEAGKDIAPLRGGDRDEKPRSGGRDGHRVRARLTARRLSRRS
jgi:hypothetical protein